jgi:hypothetical protein
LFITDILHKETVPALSKAQAQLPTTNTVASRLVPNQRFFIYTKAAVPKGNKSQIRINTQLSKRQFDLPIAVTKTQNPNHKGSKIMYYCFFLQNKTLCHKKSILILQNSWLKVGFFFLSYPIFNTEIHPTIKFTPPAK